MKVELEVGNPADPRTTTYKSSSSGWVPVKSGEVKAVVLRSPHILNVNCTQWKLGSLTSQLKEVFFNKPEVVEFAVGTIKGESPSPVDIISVMDRSAIKVASRSPEKRPSTTIAAKSTEERAFNVSSKKERLSLAEKNPNLEAGHLVSTSWEKRKENHKNKFIGFHTGTRDLVQGEGFMSFMKHAFKDSTSTINRPLRAHIGFSPKATSESQKLLVLAFLKEQLATFFELRELEIGAQEVVCSKKEGKRALTLKNPCEVQQHSDSPGYVICRIPRLKSTCLELQKNLDDKTLKSLQREEYELQRLTAQQGEIDAKVRPLKKQAIVSISDYKRTVDTMSRIQSHEGLAEQRKGSQDSVKAELTQNISTMSGLKQQQQNYKKILDIGFVGNDSI
ncbi:uncharacterized protein YALI1_A10966g [Yarrowia lipolytica]|uniref:Uncharacterized protein n=1 Tax=Yarrowia lipolytica TaxID=4952 RepID=A0A1D8N4F5_YARLL|nr:hypothetical protein YALI1_A10966g [Yarrowia lipolytica]